MSCVSLIEYGTHIYVFVSRGGFNCKSSEMLHNNYGCILHVKYEMLVNKIEGYFLTYVASALQLTIV